MAFWKPVYAMWAAIPTPGDKGEALSVFKVGSLYPEVAFAIGIIALCYAAYVFATILTGRAAPKERVFNFVAWTLGPPVFFYIEWFLIYPSQGRGFDGIQTFKQNQDIAKAVWLAIVSVLAASQIKDAITANRASDSGRCEPPVSAPRAFRRRAKEDRSRDG